MAPLTALADGTPFFSTAQLAQGRWEYSQKCAVCHGAQLQGGGRADAEGRHVCRAVERQIAEGFLQLRLSQHAARAGGCPLGPGVRGHRRLHPRAERCACGHREIHSDVADGAHARARRRRREPQRARECADGPGEDRRALRQARATVDDTAHAGASSTPPTARPTTGSCTTRAIARSGTRRSTRSTRATRRSCGPSACSSWASSGPSRPGPSCTTASCTSPRTSARTRSTPRPAASCGRTSTSRRARR